MESDKKLLSVIIPTYNSLNTLLRCIDSVLKQTYNHIEIIVIDDASTDDTSNVKSTYYSEEYRVLYFRNAHSLGPGGARHRGYMESRGDYVVYIDHDDFYTEPRFFEIALSIFEKYPELAFVSGNTKHYYEQSGKYESVPLYKTGIVDNKEYISGFGIIYSKPTSVFSSVFNKEILKQADFNNLKIMEDYLIYLKALCYGNVYFIEDMVGTYMIHGGNTSIVSYNDDYFKLLLEELIQILNFAKQRFSNLSRIWIDMQMSYVLDAYTHNPNVSEQRKKDMLNLCKKNNVRPMLGYKMRTVKRLIKKILK